jgi:hypothetical protein
MGDRAAVLHGMTPSRAKPLLGMWLLLHAATGRSSTAAAVSPFDRSQHPRARLRPRRPVWASSGGVHGAVSAEPRLMCGSTSFSFTCSPRRGTSSRGSALLRAVVPTRPHRHLTQASQHPGNCEPFRRSGQSHTFRLNREHAPTPGVDTINARTAIRLEQDADQRT